MTYLSAKLKLKMLNRDISDYEQRIARAKKERDQILKIIKELEKIFPE